MLIFPQLSTGASVQYPITRQFSQRSIRSTMDDGTVLVAPDRGANYFRWKVAFQDLSDLEAKALGDFFTLTQGSLLPFLFLDPTANLLAWSEDFSRASWDIAGLTFEPAVDDPFAGSRATRLHNPTVALQTLSQSTQIPGTTQTCFSVYVRSSAAATVTLSRTAGGETQSTSIVASSDWQRIRLTGGALSSDEPSRFALSIDPGASVEVFGPQLDAQVFPSRYVVSSGPRCSVYTAARFDIGQLEVIATGPNRNSCVVTLRCNLPIGEQL